MHPLGLKTGRARRPIAIHASDMTNRGCPLPYSLLDFSLKEEQIAWWVIIHTLTLSPSKGMI